MAEAEAAAISDAEAVEHAELDTAEIDSHVRQAAATAEVDAARAEVDPQLAAAEAEREAEQIAAVVIGTDTVPVEPTDLRRAERAERREQRREADAGKVAQRRDRRETARAEKAQVKADRRAAKKAEANDPVVPPPPSLGSSGASSKATSSRATTRERLATVVVILGALGLLLSVVLALGALLAAVDTDTASGPRGFVSDVCDVLVGPLGGLFRFSGDNADSKTDLVTRGLASMVYLVIGLALPSLARRGE